VPGSQLKVPAALLCAFGQFMILHMKLACRGNLPLPAIRAS
jgi:hypothetical protein